MVTKDHTSVNNLQLLDADLSKNDLFLKQKIEISTRVKILAKQMQTNAQIRIYSAGIYLLKVSNVNSRTGEKSVQSFVNHYQ